MRKKITFTEKEMWNLFKEGLEQIEFDLSEICDECKNIKNVKKSIKIILKEANGK